MSEASRAAALQHAVTFHAGAEGDVLETAERFHTFITGDSAAPAKTPPKVAAASKTPVKTPAKVAAKATPPAAEPEADATDEAPADEGEVTKEQVAAAIEELLNNNLRTKAIALFAKYKAKSMSGVAESDYAALKQDAEDAMLNA